MPLLPLVLVIHIALAVALFVPSLALPFALGRPSGGRPGSATVSPATPGRIVRSLLVLQGTGSVVIAIGLAITGGALLLTLGPRLLDQPWLLVALGIYVANLVIALAIQRPNLRRMLATPGSGETGRRGDGWRDDTWRDRARRQRYVSYAMAGLVGAIGWLMSTKPQLW